jgi:hypothetical protein
VKGCLLFVALFVTGLLVMISGIVYDALYGGNNPLADPVAGVRQRREDEPPENTARFLEVGGLALSFSAIFGAAGYQLYRRLHDPEEPYSEQPPPPAAGKR